jgi:hypothetical protein
MIVDSKLDSAAMEYVVYLDCVDTPTTVSVHKVSVLTRAQHCGSLWAALRCTYSSASQMEFCASARVEAFSLTQLVNS